MLCSVKDRWEDGMNQYMSTAQMVQSCRVHILISYPFETEINNPFIIGNSCQPAERSGCDCGWNSLQGFFATRKLNWTLTLRSGLGIVIAPSLGSEDPDCRRAAGQAAVGTVGSTAPATEHQCRGRFGAWRPVGWQSSPISAPGEILGPEESGSAKLLETLACFQCPVQMRATRGFWK